MDANAIATVATAGVIMVGFGALYFAMRQSGETLVEKPETVKRAIKGIDRNRLSNVISRK